MTRTPTDLHAPDATFDLWGVSRWIVVLTALVLALAYARLAMVHTPSLGMADNGFRYFDLDAEYSVPAFYSSVLFLLSAALMALIARLPVPAGAGESRRWGLLSLVFVYLSVDEATAIHERAIEPLREAFGFDGALFYAWVVPAMVLVAAFALYMLPFLWRLPRRSAVLMAVAGAIYISGALGMEMVGGAAMSAEGVSPAYDLIVAVEETLEILGLALFFAALVGHVALVRPTAAVVFRASAGAAPASQPLERLA